MSAPLLVHVEEVVFDARPYTVSVARVSGGLAGQWHCPCGEAMSLPGMHLTIAAAVQHARRELEQHHRHFHSEQAQP